MIAFTITNCSYYSSASSLYTFTDFYDFLFQYQTVIESEKPTLIEEYITWQTNSGGGFPAIINTTTAVFIYYNSSESITSCLLSHICFVMICAFIVLILSPYSKSFLNDLDIEPKQPNAFPTLPLLGPVNTISTAP